MAVSQASVVRGILKKNESGSVGVGEGNIVVDGPRPDFTDMVTL